MESCKSGNSKFTEMHDAHACFHSVPQFPVKKNLTNRSMAVGGERGLRKQCQNDGYNPARRHLVEIRYSDFSLLLSLVISISIHVTLTNRAKPENNGYFIFSAQWSEVKQTGSTGHHLI